MNRLVRICLFGSAAFCATHEDAVLRVFMLSIDRHANYRQRRPAASIRQLYYQQDPELPWQRIHDVHIVKDSVDFHSQRPAGFPLPPLYHEYMASYYTNTSYTHSDLVALTRNC